SSALARRRFRAPARQDRRRIAARHHATTLRASLTEWELSTWSIVAGSQNETNVQANGLDSVNAARSAAAKPEGNVKVPPRELKMFQRGTLRTHLVDG